MISTDYSSYYRQLYSANSIQKQGANSVSSDDSTSSKSTIDSLSSTKKKVVPFQESGNIDDLELSSRKLMHTMKMLNTDTSEESEATSAINSDMEALKTADIDNMTAEDLKTTFSNLLADMQSIQKTDKNSDNAPEVDLDIISESDMRDMLKVIQQRSINEPEHTQKSSFDDEVSKLVSDMESIKVADIDSMSLDDIKSTLANLITDMDSIKRPTGGYNNTTQVNLDAISESDMRDMLQKIQNSANNVSAQNEVSESTDSLTNLNEDIENIKAVDIDTLSLNELKEILMDLITDMKSVYDQTQVSSDESDEPYEIGIDTMTETEMRDFLKNIQENESDSQMMDGLNLTSMLTRIFSDGYDSSQLDSSNNILSEEDLIGA
ncbi:hypothetical protein [Clostridium vincentii]|uniref:Uncharacterized protein n=1 Tax=Clostridium vincentii TaxID=52704 RepID=A0A2T0BJL0_9CLOT|nr:hypothetical protein [Clostridium vincentii]PRR84061.1 hypothetical protein CLVI_03590 [Clostridium vincentii]